MKWTRTHSRKECNMTATRPTPSPINNPKLIENYVYSPGWAVKSTVNITSVNGLLKGNYFVSPGPDKRTVGSQSKTTALSWGPIRTSSPA